MSVTFEVSKDDRSAEVSFEQPLNMEDMSVTFEVSKDDRSAEVSLKQPENIFTMFVTAEVSRPTRLSDVSDVQPENRLQHVLAETPGSTTTDLIDVRCESHGARPDRSNTPEAPSSNGRTVSRPSPSIFHSQVPHTFQPGVWPFVVK